MRAGLKNVQGMIPALVQLIARAGTGAASCSPSLLPYVKYVAAMAAKALALLAFNGRSIPLYLFMSSLFIISF